MRIKSGLWQIFFESCYFSEKIVVHLQSVLRGTTENNAGVLKLVDKPDLGSGAERRMGSIPFARTKRLFRNQVLRCSLFFCNVL